MGAGIAVTIALLLMPNAACAQSEKRIALLIGNQGYSTKIGALKNPHATLPWLALPCARSTSR